MKDGKFPPFFSIIIPVLNSLKTIEKCIGSVVRENSSASYELIIIDGGSTDGTLEILEKYHNYIDYVSSVVDNGPHFAVNSGLKIAKGEVVVILCADDYLGVDSLNKIHQKFLENPELDLLSCGIRIYDSQGKIINEYINPIVLDFTVENIIKTPLSHGRFIKKRIYDLQGGFPVLYNLCNDLYFLLRIRICENIKTDVLCINSYNYLSHHNSSTMGNNPYKIIETYMDNYSIAKFFINNFKFNYKILFNFYELLYKSLFKFLIYYILLNKKNIEKIGYDNLSAIKGIHFFPFIFLKYLYQKCKMLKW